MKPIFSLILLASTFCAFAQKETLDNVTFTPPTGWTKDKSDSAVIYAQSDAKSGAFCKLVIIKAVPGSGKVKTDFDEAWKLLVKDSLKIQNAPESQPADKKNGWDILSGGGVFDVEKDKVAVILITASNATKTQSVLVLTNGGQYQAEIQAFLTSLDMKKAIEEPKQPTTKTSISNGNARTPQLWITTGILGGYELGEVNNLKPRYRWFAIYPNGDFYPYLPDEGFLGFDREPSNESWGKATINGKKMTLESKPWGRLKLEKISDKQWNVEGSKLARYEPCKPVDGLKIEGAYSADGIDWTKKKATSLPVGVTYITFKKDGSFVDYGCFNSPSVNKPSKGTYFIKNFTIVFQYEDGFVKKRGFCSLGGIDPFKEDAAYIMGQYTWYKGKL